jgi:hypothetical protein
MTKGLIALPPIEDDIINVSARNQSDECRGYDLLSPVRPITPEFLVLHKAQSEDEAGVTLGSPHGYFTLKCCPALTDMEVNPTTARMRRFVKRGTKIAGWANGRISGPYGDALKYIEYKQSKGEWFPSLANIAGEAIEILGWFPSYPVTQDTPVSELTKVRLAQWMASRAHDYGITYIDFPNIPDEMGRSYILWHREWTLGTGKTCPGPYVMGITSELIEMARAIMKAAQLKEPEEATPTYAPPILPFWWNTQLQLLRPNDAKFRDETLYVVQRNFKALDTTQRYSEPRLGADISGPPVLKDIKVTGERIGVFEKRTWILEETGHWLLASGFSPKVSISPRTT